MIKFFILEKDDSTVIPEYYPRMGYIINTKQKNIINYLINNTINTEYTKLHNPNRAKLEKLIPSGSNIYYNSSLIIENSGINNAKVRNYINVKQSEGVIISKTRKLENANVIISDFATDNYKDLKINNEESYYLKLDLLKLSNKLIEIDPTLIEPNTEDLLSTTTISDKIPYNDAVVNSNNHKYNLNVRQSISSYLRNTYNMTLTEDVLVSNDFILISMKDGQSEISQFKQNHPNTENYISFIKGYDFIISNYIKGRNEDAFIDTLDMFIELYNNSKYKFKILCPDVANKIFSRYKDLMTLQEYNYIIRLKKSNNTLGNEAFNKFNPDSASVEYFKEKFKYYTNDTLSTSSIAKMRKIILENKDNSISDNIKQDYFDELTMTTNSIVQGNLIVKDNINCSSVTVIIHDKDIKINNIYGNYITNFIKKVDD